MVRSLVLAALVGLGHGVLAALQTCGQAQYDPTQVRS